ncbi:MAG: tetratricopeptide repeat protein [candidate division WOR-3 bacterium]
MIKNMNIVLILLTIFCATKEKVKVQNISEEDKVKARHLYIRASAYLNQERYNEAIPLLNDAKALDPYFVEAYIALGNAYLSLKDTLKAKENFLEATKISPDDKRGYQGLGFLYGVYLRNYEKGIYFYKKSYDIDKTDLNTLLVVARLFEKINKDSAEFYYKKILSINPENPEALKKYLNFLVEEKRFNEALIYANRAIEKLSNDETVMESAFKVYIQMGEAKKAIEIANELIKKNPDDYVYYLMRGTAYASLNNYKSALSDYNKAESLNPKSVGVYIRKALLYNELKDYNKSLIEGKKALDLQPKSEEVLSAVYYVIAESYKGLALNSEEKKDWDQALDLWEKAKTWYSRIYSLGDTPYRDYSLKMVDYTSKKWEKVKRIKLGIDEG